MGSEMCIRDRPERIHGKCDACSFKGVLHTCFRPHPCPVRLCFGCLEFHMCYVAGPGIPPSLDLPSSALQAPTSNTFAGLVHASKQAVNELSSSHGPPQSLPLACARGTLANIQGPLDNVLVSAAAAEARELMGGSYPRAAATAQGPIVDSHVGGHGSRHICIFLADPVTTAWHRDFVKKNRFCAGGSMFVKTMVLPNTAVSLWQVIASMRGVYDAVGDYHLTVVQLTTSDEGFQLMAHHDPDIWPLTVSVTLEGSATFQIGGQQGTVSKGEYWAQGSVPGAWPVHTLHGHQPLPSKRLAMILWFTLANRETEVSSLG